MFPTAAAAALLGYSISCEYTGIWLALKSFQEPHSHTFYLQTAILQS
jgi:hypothetical protein